MVNGIGFALGACFIWGLIFIVPQFMDGFNPIEIALGRYFFYGVVSCFIFCKLKLQGACKYPFSIWKKGLFFSLVSTMIYYIFLVLAVRYSTPAICALVLGVSPILIAFYGNWKQKEVSFKVLITPSLLILAGLAIINIPHLEQSDAPSTYVLGLLCSFIALAAWSWYVVANCSFLKQHPEVESSDWATIIGVVTLFWVAAFAVFLRLFAKNTIQLEKYLTVNSESIAFFSGSAILGLLCSWVGGFLWNKASVRLPVSLAGQLTIFETIFGVLFFYILSRRLPPITEAVGIVILLAAIIYGIRQFYKNQNLETASDNNSRQSPD